MKYLYISRADDFSKILLHRLIDFINYKYD